MIENYIKTASFSPASIALIDDKIIELTSELQKTKSLILTSAILKHSQLTAATNLIFKVVDSVKQCLEQIRKARKLTKILNNEINAGHLALVKLYLLQCQAMKASLALRDLKKLKEYEISLKNCTLDEHCDKLLPFLFELKNLLKQLTITITTALESNVFPSQRLEALLKFQAKFMNEKSFAVVNISEILSSHILSITHNVLAKYSNQRFIGTIRELTSISSLVSEIRSKEHISVSLQRLVEKFWQMILLYHRLKEWVSNAHHLHSKKSTITSFEIACFAVLAKNIENGKAELVELQQQQLNIVLSSIPMTIVTAEIFINIIRVLLRYSLEAHTWLSSKIENSANDTLTIKTYNKHALRNIWAIPTCRLLLEKLEQFARTFLNYFHEQNLILLKTYISDDTWQRLPTSKVNIFDVIHLEVLDSDNTLMKLVFWEITEKNSRNQRTDYLIPAWLRLYNPFSQNVPPLYAEASFSLSTGEQNIRRKDGLFTDSYFTSLKMKNNIEVEELYVSNQGPVLSLSTYKLCCMTTLYLRLIRIAPFLQFRILLCAIGYLKYIIHATLQLFVDKDYFNLLLVDTNFSLEWPSSPVLYRKHSAFLVQRATPSLELFASSFNLLTRNSDNTTLPPIPAYSFFSNFPLNEYSESIDVTQLQQLISEEVQCLRSLVEKFTITDDFNLDNPENLWALAERVTAVESCQTYIDMICHFFLPTNDESKKTLHNSWPTPKNEQLISKICTTYQTLVSETRYFVYGNAAKALFCFDRLIYTLELYEWNETYNKDIKPAVSQLRHQLYDLKRKIACCGGGCIPKYSQKKIWLAIAAEALRACVEGVAKNNKEFLEATGEVPKSLHILKADFSSFIMIFEECIRKISENQTEQVVDTQGIDMSYLINYIEAHMLKSRDALYWCKSQFSIYHVYLLTRLVRKIEKSQQTRREMICDIETTIVQMLQH